MWITEELILENIGLIKENKAAGTDDLDLFHVKFSD